MNVTRRKLIAGSLLGVTGALGLLGKQVRETYESDVWIVNNRSSSVEIEFELSNLDEGKAVLDESMTLDSGEKFHRQGVFSDSTRYRVQVFTERNSEAKKFETCCHGFLVNVSVEQDALKIEPIHYD